MIALEFYKEKITEWKEIRSKGIGSSEISTVMGLNPFQSPLELWAEKTLRMPPAPENEHMFLGRLMEPVIADLFEKKIKDPDTVSLFYANAHLFKLDSEEFGFALATPDYFYVNPQGGLEIVEIKNTSFHNLKKWEDGIPQSAHCQIIWQMGVLGHEHGKLVALVGGDPTKLFIKEVDFCSKIWNQMLESATEFMDCVKKDIPPKVQGSDLELLRKLNPITDKVEEFTSPEEIENYAKVYSDYKRASDKIKELNKEVELYKEDLKDQQAKLLQRMKDASILKHPEFEFIRKVTKRKSFFVAETEFETFKIKGTKDDV